VPGKPIDWDALRREYLKGGSRTIRHFAQVKGISESRMMHVAAKEKWQQLRKKAEHIRDAKITERHAREATKVGESQASDVDKMNSRHRDLAGKMLTAGKRHIEQEGATENNVVSMIKEGVNIERLTYGEDTGSMNITIVTNVPEPEDVKEWMQKYGNRLRTGVHPAARV
jgi:hypothetical protein